jgi:hypothetical protein
VVREKTKAAIKAAFWIFIVMPAMWFVLTSSLEMLGVKHPMSFSSFAILMVVFGAFAIYNITKME